MSSVAFSPDGRTLATASGDKTARLWELASGREIAVLRGHESDVWSLAFSPEGGTLATASLDKSVRLWEVATGKQVAVLRGVWSPVAFSPDGQTMATGSDDDTARLWPVGQRLIDLACSRVHELPLNDRDKERFGIDHEWCPPEASAVLQTKHELDRSDDAITPEAAR